MQGDAGREEKAEVELQEEIPEGGTKGEVLEVKLRCFL